MRLNTISCIILCCVVSCFNNAAAQIATDTFNVAKIPIFISAATEGAVISNVNKAIDPFYHASAYLMSVINIHFGKHVQIPIRITAENQNFSGTYDNEDNFITWIKPALVANITTVPILDSLNIQAGDLWRLNPGHGLILDNFEAHGAKFKFVYKDFSLEFVQCGAGILGWDDLQLYSINYKRNASIRFFNDYYGAHKNYSYESFSRIISADVVSVLNKNISIYTEAGINIDTKAKAGMAGIKLYFESPRYYLDLKAEFRHYDNFFFRNNYKQNLQYFRSLTALDKPINSYVRYAASGNLTNVLAGRLKGRYYFYKNFFAGVDIEPILGDTSLLAYEAVFGCEVEKNIRFMAGIMNKFYTDGDGPYYYNESIIFIQPSAPMFYLRKKPWLMLKASLVL